MGYKKKDVIKMGIFDKFGKKERTSAEVLEEGQKFLEKEGAPKIPFPATIPAEVRHKLRQRIETDGLGEFNNLLKTDPDNALADFELTDEQLSDLKEYFRKQHEATERWLENLIEKKRS